MEELRREQALSGQQEPPRPDFGRVGHRGPCCCGMALFPDECDGSCKAL
jgi:hypothetical protein